MDIPLSIKEQKEIVGRLKGIKFEDLEVHPIISINMDNQDTELV